VHLREEIFHFCKTEGDVLTDKPTIIEAIRHPDLFDSLSKLRVVGWVGDGSRRATDKIRAGDL
jgi:hypothetical protein